MNPQLLIVHLCADSKTKRFNIYLLFHNHSSAVLHQDLQQTTVTLQQEVGEEPREFSILFLQVEVIEDLVDFCFF